MNKSCLPCLHQDLLELSTPENDSIYISMPKTGWRCINLGLPLESLSTSSTFKSSLKKHGGFLCVRVWTVLIDMSEELQVFHSLWVVSKLCVFTKTIHPKQNKTSGLFSVKVSKTPTLTAYKTWLKNSPINENVKSEGKEKSSGKPKRS